VAAGLLATLLPLVGCGAVCHPSGGGRCAGPAPISESSGPLTLAADGRTLSGFFACGGRLAVRESATRVTLTFVASAVGSGGRTCPTIPLSIHLHTALGTRAVVDGVSHQIVRVERR
jgi:hypothetical protein